MQFHKRLLVIILNVIGYSKRTVPSSELFALNKGFKGDMSYSAGVYIKWNCNVLV